jgi:hypothetical protein
VFESTLTVVTGKVAEVEPAGTVTLVGTKAGDPFVHSCTAVPPAGAATLRLTVPITEFPPTTVAGETDTDVRAATWAGVTVRVEVLLEPL